MRNIVTYIRQSLSWKLSLGIVLMAVPIFMLSLGILFRQSRNKVKEETTVIALFHRITCTSSENSII